MFFTSPLELVVVALEGRARHAKVRQLHRAGPVHQTVPTRDVSAKGRRYYLLYEPW